MQPTAAFTPASHSPSRPRDRLATARLYLCTDARRDTGDLTDFLDEVLAGGVDIVQLRDKDSAGQRAHGPLTVHDELAVLSELKAATRRHGALSAVNDRADIALAAGADVLHLGQQDLPPWYARRILGSETVIGRSTHTLQQARRAAHDENLDYFCVGPIWATPTKPGRAAVGLSLVEQVAALQTTRPWFAIGGIDPTNVSQVVAAGAERIVVVRALTQATNPRGTARELKNALLEI